MKIALTIEHFEPRRGGGETYCRNFARMLLEAGVPRVQESRV